MFVHAACIRLGVEIPPPHQPSCLPRSAWRRQATPPQGGIKPSNELARSWPPVWLRLTIAKPRQESYLRFYLLPSSFFLLRSSFLLRPGDLSPSLPNLSRLPGGRYPFLREKEKAGHETGSRVPPSFRKGVSSPLTKSLRRRGRAIVAEDKARDRVESPDSARERNAVFRPQGPDACLRAPHRQAARMDFFNWLLGGRSRPRLRYDLEPHLPEVMIQRQYPLDAQLSHEDKAAAIRKGELLVPISEEEYPGPFSSHFIDGLDPQAG